MRLDREPAWPAVTFGLITSLLLVVMPVWQELAHGELGHGEAGHESEHSVADHAVGGHEECDGWSTRTDRHQDHSDLQFELAEASRHQHHGLCTGHSSLTGHASSTTVEIGHDLSSPSAVGRLLAPARRASAQPPSRGPPAVV